MDLTPIRFIQLSDVHLFADPEQELLGVKTHHSFAAVLALLKKEVTAPQFIIVSGDLSQDYTQQSYLHLANMLKDFPTPVYVIPGNHDDVTVMANVFPKKNIIMDKQIILDHWQIILLDSHQHRQVPGFLSEKQLDFMERCLRTHPKHHAIVVFHHHPVPVGSTWLDRLGLTNADDFWKIAQGYPQLKIVLFGHVHQEHAGQHQTIDYYSVPATCIQFKPNAADFALDPLPPGYRWVDLFANGSIKTGVSRVDHYVGHFDAKSIGY